MATNADCEKFERTTDLSIAGGTDFKTRDLPELLSPPGSNAHTTAAPDATPGNDLPPLLPTAEVDLSHDSELLSASVPTSGKRKRKAAPVEDRNRALKKVTFDREMTAQIMLWFDDCRERGLFISAKKDYRPIWQEVLERCQELWPQYSWKPEIISAKYDTERRRYRQWKALVDGYPSVTYDYSTGLPQMPEATWTRFVKRNNMNSRSVAWLRTIPLGDVDVYRSVFERATGRYIAEAGEIADAQLESTDSEDSDWDNPDIFDNDSESESINNIETPVPKRRRSTAAQQYRLTYRYNIRLVVDKTILLRYLPPLSSQPLLSLQPHDSLALRMSLGQARIYRSNLLARLATLRW
ncbi:hypothetical protein VTH82DRAFT_5379 [Thermothelomyces myriococcoides]